MAWRGLAVVAVALGCVIALSGSAALAAGEEIVVESTPLNPAQPSNWIDPAVATSDASNLLLRNTCLPLYEFDDATGKLTTAAAVQMPGVEGGTTYTISIRNEQKFSDGEDVGPESFKRAIERATSPAMATSLGTAPPLRALVGVIDGATEFFNNQAADISGLQPLPNSGLEIVLDEPTPTFVRELLTRVCASHSDDPAGVSVAPLPSAGPYYIDSAAAAEVVLAPNPDYVGGRVFEPGVIRWGDHDSSLPEDYVSGALGGYDPPAGALDLSNPTTGLERFVLATHRPPFDDPNLRRAVALAIDRTALSIAHGGIRPTDQLLPPLVEGYRNVEVFPLDGSGAAEAAALVGGTDPAVQLCYASNEPRAALTALAETQLEAAGFVVEVVPYTAGEFFGEILPDPNICELKLVTFQSGRDAGATLRNLFHSDAIPPAGSNYSFFDDGNFDLRMDNADELADASRVADYGQIDIDLTATAPAVAIGVTLRRDVFSDRMGCRYLSQILWGYAVNRLCVQAAAEYQGVIYTVNTNADEFPADAGCTADDCTFREAIEAANANLGEDTIIFNIGAGGPQVIRPATALPPITDPVTIDATTQAGFGGTPIVEIDGSTVAAADGGDGLVLSGGLGTVRGLVINDFAGDSGIVLASGNNVVEGNYIGFDATGEIGHPNGTGIEVLEAENTIGGITEAARNVISGNSSDNVRISGDFASGNFVVGNYIGTTPNGIGGLGGSGVRITNGAFSNTIGGAQRNVIAGNSGNGVEITNNGTTGNLVEGNYIGLGATGLAAVGNEGAGVEIVGPDSSNFVHDNWITGNIDGIVIGGSDTGTSGQIVEFNRIGLTSVDVEGNLGRGIFVNGTSSGDTSNNSISFNTIAGSGGAGIFVDDDAGGTATGNSIQSNTIRASGGLGIDLAPAGVTPNDADDTDAGANNLQNFPVLTSVTVNEGETVIEGTLTSAPGVLFGIDFFVNSACDGSDHGEGEAGIAGASVTVEPDGDVSFAETVPGELGPTDQVTATATNLETGDTSEFSACAATTGGPQVGPTFTVNTAIDSLSPPDAGCSTLDCTFREATEAANSNPGADTIDFDIPGAGPHTITIAASWPIITQPVTIDGTSQPGYADTPLIEFDGGNNSFTGLSFNINTGQSLVRGLAINRWQTAVETRSGVNLSLEDNYIGVSPDGVTARPNGSGVVLLGGTGEITGNVISGNSQVGLSLRDVSDVIVQDNRIGTNAAGSASLGANPIGVEIFPTGGVGASGVTIEGNLISGNSSSGIEIKSSTNSSVTQTTILGNLIGTNADGTSALANGHKGISIRGFGVNGPATDTTIGGTAPGEGNTIAFNGNDGVGIETNGAGSEHLRNSIRGNSIHSNGRLGIDLGVEDVTANDALDADPGANNLQNFPVLTGAGSTVSGDLDSAAGQTYTIDVYSNAACDSFLNGEGAVHVTSFDVVTDGSGHVAFNEPVSPPLTGGVATATATDSVGNTSEFSACQTVTSGSQPGPTFTVNTTADGTPQDAGCSSTDCTLREAITVSNAQPGANTIEFEIAGPGPHEIVLGSVLPAIAEDLTLDAASEPDWVDAPVVGISGGVDITHGLEIVDGTTTVRALAVGGFSSTGIDANGGQLLLSASYVGTNIAGTAANPNGVGVRVEGPFNEIGDAEADEGNLISGNTEDGILVEDGSNTLIQGNRIGTDATGTAEVPNRTGIRIVAGEGDVIDNRIGGDEPGQGNLVSGNISAGILLRGTVGAGVTGTEITGNLIGTAADGVSDLGNGGDGVQLGSPGNLTGNGIGDTTTGSGNTIAYNDGAGVSILNVDSNRANRIAGNSIHSNGGLGIDLGADGPTPNDALDADTGANDLQNFPVLTSASATTLSGELESEPGEMYQIHVYANESCGEGGWGTTFVDSFPVFAGDDGRVEFTDAPLGATASGLVSATATDPEGNTSELSECIGVETSYTVNSNTDGTDPGGCDLETCTLREAIEAANADDAPSTILFDLGIFPHITLETGLPEITEPVVVDGGSEPSGSVTLDGAGEVFGDGLRLAPGSDGSRISGLHIEGFTSQSAETYAAGIHVLSNGNEIIDNSIALVRNGIVVGGSATGNDIGGLVEEGQGNEIWGFLEHGVLVDAAGPGNHVSGNTIGLDPTTNLGDGGDTGIAVVGTAGTVVGHDLNTTELPNYNRANVVVAGSEAGSGILLSGFTSSTRVVGNFVGIDRAGERSDLGNSGPGILVVGGSNGNQLGNGNVIAHNGSHGIDIRSSSLNRISANSIHSNAGLGISFTSANEGTSAPELESATKVGTTTTFDTRITGVPGRIYWVEFFKNTVCDDSGSGEGETYFGFAQVTLTNESDVIPLPRGGYQAGDFVTTTLTDSMTAETSDFSNCITVADGDVAQSGPTFTVNSNSDQQPFANAGCTIGECALREAIEAANTTEGTNTIEFAMPGRTIASSPSCPRSPIRSRSTGRPRARTAWT